MSGGIDKLVRMANQIAAEFDNQRPVDAAAATWDHLWHFWDPRMRASIIADLDAGGTGLSPTARAAVELLSRPVEPDSRTRATEFATDRDGNSGSDAG